VNCAIEVDILTGVIVGDMVWEWKYKVEELIDPRVEENSSMKK
jgi:hypothetical protein